MKKTQYVDPTIGTVGGGQSSSAHGGGKTHPGACYPFGMIQLSPDTMTYGDNGTGYNYCADTIEGFSFNHMSGVGWYGDLGNLQIMPTVGKTDLRSGSNREIPFQKGSYGWRSPFSHENETARAGYYAVMLDRYRVFCEATVSRHAGQLRFTYPESNESGIIFNFSRRIAGRSHLQKIEIKGRTVCGSIVCDHRYGGFGRGAGNVDYTLFFCLEVSMPFRSARFFEYEEFLADGVSSLEGEDLHLLVEFDTKEKEPVLIRCAISYVDLEGAKQNLLRECPFFDFEKMRSDADAAWEEAFRGITVNGSDETDLTLFYTCLYHTLLDPRVATDTDGRYTVGDRIQTSGYTHRTVFSGWDVYRSEFPLLSLISPESVNDTVSSLLQIALTKNTSFPRWELMGNESACMVGDPGLIVAADAYCKGIRNYDTEKAYAIALASSLAKKALFEKPFLSLRPSDENYKKHAFLPRDLSSTLELLLADRAMANFALAMGKAEDHLYFSERAERYPENFNPGTGFMAPRDENGEFLAVKDRYDTLGCVESNIYQQSFFVPYDVEGLGDLFGKERFLTLLEELFEKADLTSLWNENYNHSNEPCHNITHYFALVGAPERTDYWTRRVQKEAYRKGAFGFCGNEDVGQLSAWYVLSALGFAQICMSDGKYHLNAPLFRSAKIRLDEKYHPRKIDGYFRVECDRDPLEFPYIDRVTLNGKALDRRYLTYEEITNGGVLSLYLKK